MTIVKKWLTTVALLLIITCSCFSADIPLLFRQAFAKLKTVPASSKGVHIKYSVVVQTPTGQTYSDNVDFRLFEKRSLVESSRFSVYQDEKTLVMIQPEVNSILLSRPVDDAFKKMQLQNIIVLQDSIFKYMNVEGITEDNAVLGVDGKPCKKMIFRPISKLKTNLGVAMAVYWIDETNVQVRKVVLEYVQDGNHQMKSIMFDFLLFDAAYSKNPFDGPAISSVLDSKNRLKSVFQNYSLVDRRK